MRSGKKVFSFDSVVIAIAGVLLIASLYLLANDYMIFPVKDRAGIELIEVGRVSNQNHDVRRKVKSNFAWLPLIHQARVFDGDSLFTGPDSSLKINMISGVEMTIAENSLVVLREDVDDLVLNLKYGEIKRLTKSTGTIVLNRGNEQTKIKSENAVLRIRAAKNQKIELKVISGKASLKTKKKAVVSLKANEAVKISTAGAVEKAPIIEIDLIKPKDSTTIWAEGSGAQVNFEWTKSPGAKLYQLQIARDSKFTGIVEERITKDNQAQINSPDLREDIYWRVRAVKKLKNKTLKAIFSSEPFSFSVRDNISPKLIAPLDGSTLILSSGRVIPPGEAIKRGREDADKKERQTFHFKWQPNGYPRVKLELSTENSFQSIVKSIESEKSDLVIGDLAKGTFYWRIVGIDVQRPKNLVSEVFRLNALKEIPIDPLLSPKVKVLAKNWLLKPIKGRNPSSQNDWYSVVDRGGKTVASLAWSPVKSAKSYNVIVASDKGFKEKVFSQVTNKTQIQWPGAKPGKYYWGVQAMAPDRADGPFSKVGHLEVISAAPKLNSVENILEKVMTKREMNAELKPVKLSWLPTPMASGYAIEVANRSQFNNSKKIISKKTNTEVKLAKTGSYYWRAWAIDAENKPISSMSEVKSFVYSRQRGLRTPATSSPEFDSTMIFLSKAASHVVLIWRKVQGAEAYEIQMANNDSFKNPYYKNKTFALKELVQMALPNGKNYWRIRAVSDKYKSDWTAAIPFVVSYDK